MTIKKFNLQLFAEGAAATGGEAGAEGAVDAEQQDTGENIQDAAETEVDDEEARKAQWDEMIKGEYRDLYQNQMQEIVTGRLQSQKKETEELASRLEGQSSIIDTLCQRYNCTFDKLQDALDSDINFFEAAAQERGMTVDQYKEWTRMEQENARLREAAEERERRQQGEQVWNNWLSQSEKMKKIYPDFNLGAEIDSDEEFGKLLQNGIPVKTAYEVIHMDEIMNGVLGSAVNQTAKAVANNIGARNRRASENGTNSQAVASKQYDVNKMTKREREELIKRAARGETIKL